MFECGNNISIENVSADSITFQLFSRIQINDLTFSGPDDQYFATCSTDGILHLWSGDNLEHLQFQVQGQVCDKVECDDRFWGVGRVGTHAQATFSTNLN